MTFIPLRRLAVVVALRAAFMMVYQGYFFIRETLGGKAIETLTGAANMAMSDIAIDVVKVDDIYHFMAQYRANKYSEKFIESLCDALGAAAKSMLTAQTLGEVEICSERAKVEIKTFNRTDYPIKMHPMHKLFEVQVEKHSEEIAMVVTGEQFSFAEMNTFANRIVHSLLTRGIESESIVELVLPQTAFVDMCEYGIWKAGGAFLPMVPDYPDDRIEFCLLDSHSKFCITTALLLSLQISSRYPKFALHLGVLRCTT